MSIFFGCFIVGGLYDFAQCLFEEKKEPNKIITDIVRNIFYNNTSEIMFYKVNIMNGIKIMIRLKDKNQDQYNCNVFMDWSLNYYLESVKKINDKDRLFLNDCVTFS